MAPSTILKTLLILVFASFCVIVVLWKFSVMATLKNEIQRRTGLVDARSFQSVDVVTLNKNNSVVSDRSTPKSATTKKMTLIQTVFKNSNTPFATTAASGKVGSVLNALPVTINKCDRSKSEPEYTYKLAYLLNPVKLCEGKKLTFIVFVTSKLDNEDRRNAIRETWAKWNPEKMKVFFVVGNTTNEKLKANIKAESDKNKDVLQANVLDDYHNLVYKVIAAFDWIEKYCYTQPTYVIKSDDDTLINIDILLSNMRSSHPLYIMCWKMTGQRPHRDPSSPWYITNAEYPPANYPNFCSGGGGYAFPVAVVKTLLGATKNLCPIYLEDVYVTGILRNKAGIPIEARNPMIHYIGTQNRCAIKYGISTHYVTAKQIRELWKTLPSLSCNNPFG